LERNLRKFQEEIDARRLKRLEEKLKNSDIVGLSF
jgi:hypothetical protein